MTSLLIVQTLTRLFQQAEIRYCHWKSNEHVDAAVEGKTDLDVLVDRSAKSRLPTLLSEIGFKYFEAIACRRYVDIDDYLAIDEDTGQLVHLHLHYTLELGEKQLKGYDVPWEELILSTRIYDQQHQIYTAEPNIEIILLMVRAALKVRSRDRIKHTLGKSYFKGDFIREFRWLKERIDVDRVRELSETLLNKSASKWVLAAIQDEANLKQILSFRNPIYLSLQRYRRYHPLVSTGLRWQREVENLTYKVLRQYLNLPVTTRRVSPQGGMIIAILGADGSGKSTVKSEIVRCLSQKLDVLPIYLGSGDGTASWMRMPLIWLTKSAKKAKKSSASSKASEFKKPKSKLSQLVKVLWAITLVYEKRDKLKQAQIARERGMIVVSDRYPQIQFLGFNDGALLSGSESIPRSLQQWEFNHYRFMAEKMPPDLVIKLNVTPEVALNRKPESPADIVCQKVNAIQALQFSPPTIVVDIDATQSLEQVILEVKQAIWEHI